METLDSLLVRLYATYGIPCDRLPYSAVMARICSDVERTMPGCGRPELIWKTLVALRKAGSLPRVGRLAK